METRQNATPVTAKQPVHFATLTAMSSPACEQRVCPMLLVYVPAPATQIGLLLRCDDVVMSSTHCKCATLPWLRLSVSGVGASG